MMMDYYPIMTSQIWTESGKNKGSNLLTVELLENL